MYKIFIICCAVLVTSFIEGLAPLPNDVKAYETRLSALSKNIESEQCHDEALFYIFIKVVKKNNELKKIYYNIQRGEDNTAQLTKIAKLKNLVEDDLSLIEKKFSECVKFKVIGPQESGNVSGGYRKREDRRPEPPQTIEYVQSPLTSDSSNMLDHISNDYKK
jgi:hypothetical protein